MSTDDLRQDFGHSTDYATTDIVQLPPIALMMEGHIEKEGKQLYLRIKQIVREAQKEAYKYGRRDENKHCLKYATEAVMRLDRLNRDAALGASQVAQAIKLHGEDLGVESTLKEETSKQYTCVGEVFGVPLYTAGGISFIRVSEIPTTKERRAFEHHLAGLTITRPRITFVDPEDTVYAAEWERFVSFYRD